MIGVRAWVNVVITSARPAGDSLFIMGAILGGTSETVVHSVSVAASERRDGSLLDEFIRSIELRRDDCADIEGLAQLATGRVFRGFAIQKPINEGSSTTITRLRSLKPLLEKHRSKVQQQIIELREAVALPAVGSSKDFGLPSARVFQWSDAATLSRREWLYGKAALRGAVTVTVGAGATGKSALHLVEALAMVTGKPLLGLQPRAPLRVWVINLEDKLEELELRLAAARRAHGLTIEDCAERLFVNGRETKLCIATASPDAGTVIVESVVDEIVEEIVRHQIDVIIIDPFVSSHRVNENDNMSIDLVAKTWAQIADEAEVAVMIVHHTRKSNGGEVTSDDGRGASSLINAARIGREINPMSKDQADEAGVPDRRHQYFYITDGKPNYAPRNEKREWYQIISHVLPNGQNGLYDGENVGVVVRWEWPDTRIELSADKLEAVCVAIGGNRCRRDHQAHAYVGKIIAAALGIDSADRQSMRGVKSLVAKWIKDGALVEREGLTDKSEKKWFVEIGDWQKAVART